MYTAKHTTLNIHFNYCNWTFFIYQIQQWV